MRIFEITENFAEGKVNYTMPNFNFEWEEANRYEQYRKIGKEAWIKLAKTGKVVDVDNRTANDIENTDAGEEYRDDHWDGLVQAKRDRFTQAISSGQIELPIIARYSDGQLELISGNTRLTGMMRELGKAKAWIYDVPDEIADLEENFADGKKKESIEEGGKPNTSGYKLVKKSDRVELYINEKDPTLVIAILDDGAWDGQWVGNNDGWEFEKRRTSGLYGYFYVNDLKDLFKSNFNENFADGEKKGKSRPGRFKKAGVSCKGSVTSLRKKAKNSSGERQKGYHFCANMKSGRKKG